jgi:hypothetical protein
VKVFISYATEDGSTASSLDDDLHVAGATTFLFGRSETSGETSWSEVLTWIGDSDAFIALISASALDSTPVQEEIDHAHYCYINSNRSKPAKLIPAILEPGTEPPVAIRRFTRLDLTDYRTGLDRLLSDLRLTKSVLEGLTPPERRESLPAIDFEELIGRTDRPSARPLVEQKWSDDAAKLLFNYEKLKPDELAGPEEVDHIDSLLGKYSGKPVTAFGDPDFLKKADAKFLGIESSRPWGAMPDLADALLEPGGVERVPLSAPTLTVLGLNTRMLSWDEVPAASGYVLEHSSDPSFILASEVESDSDTFHLVGAEGGGHYRVKAKGGVLFDDSAWSNHVEVEADEPAPSPILGPLDAPSLRASRIGLEVALEWFPVFAANGYVLERTSWNPGPVSEEIYEGSDTAYTDTSPAIWSTPTYRVKARDLFHRESPWSDPVEP